MPTFVSIPGPVYDLIARWAEKAYPFEGCGLLLGIINGNGRNVRKFVPMENKLLKKDFAVVAERDIPVNLPVERLSKPEIGFAMDPVQFSQETLKAGKEDLDVVGIVHTHPDHPPRPSKIDESQPFLAQWSNIIVAVHQAKTVDMKSWFRELDNEPFVEEEIRVER